MNSQIVKNRFAAGLVGLALIGGAAACGSDAADTGTDDGETPTTAAVEEETPTTAAADEEGTDDSTADETTEDSVAEDETTTTAGG